MNEIKSTKWWNEAKYPNFTQSPHQHVWHNWAELIFVKEALQNGTTVYSFQDDLLFKDINELYLFFKENDIKQFWQQISYQSESQKSFRWDQGIVNIFHYGVPNGATVNIVTPNKELIDKFHAFLKAETVPKNQQKSIYVMTMTEDGPSLVNAGNANLPLERSNYEDKVLFDYDYVSKQLSEKTPYGRLVIFNGLPGSGKSFIIRGLLDEIKNATFVLIPPDMIVDLTGPTFIRPLLNLRAEEGIDKGSVVLILEDADRILVSRGADNMTQISTLLNFGDGIFGTLFDIRIIATTNAKKLEMDPAIMRPGRLCRMVDVNELSAEKANKAFFKLTGKDGDFKNKTTLAEVYKKANHSEWKSPLINEEVGFKRQS